MLYGASASAPVPTRFPPVRSVTFALIAVALGQGCKKTPEPTGSDGPSFLAMGAGSKPATPPVAPSALPLGVTWADPAGWVKDAKSNPMRKATYRIPRAKGDEEDAELAIFYFGPGQGGGIDANVERWVKQFSKRKPDEPKRADRTANGLHQHTVEIEEGTYDGGMGMQGAKKERPGFALLGAIVEAPSGAYFFKLTGPKATVQRSRDSFYELLDSIKPAS